MNYPLLFKQINNQKLYITGNYTKITRLLSFLLKNHLKLNNEDKKLDNQEIKLILKEELFNLQEKVGKKFKVNVILTIFNIIENPTIIENISKEL